MTNFRPFLKFRGACKFGAQKKLPLPPPPSVGDRGHIPLEYRESDSFLFYVLFCERLACACNVHGSLSTFCGSSSGQCQCRRGFDGKKCDKCRVGFFGFPNCQECNCHVSGMKPIAGLMSGCNSSLAV